MFVASWGNELSFYMTRVRMATGKEITSARKVLPGDQSFGTRYAFVISLTHDQRNTGATSVCYPAAQRLTFYQQQSGRNCLGSPGPRRKRAFYHPSKRGWERVESLPYSGGPSRRCNRDNHTPILFDNLPLAADQTHRHGAGMSKP